MSTGNQSCLRFSLEESVWFQRGQEVAELISISLDPNITIQENDQYVTIKGSLELTGEYTSDDQEEAWAEEKQFEPRLIHTVLERKEGRLEFLHRFPVDITIPQNRIESIYDIDITVESFDYDFPERGSLTLSAELAITGLYGEQQHGSDKEDEPGEISESVDITELEPLYRKTEIAKTEETDYEVLSDSSQEDSVGDTAQEIAGLYEPFQAEARKETQINAVNANNNEEQNLEFKPNVEHESAREPESEHEPVRVIEKNPFAALAEEPAKLDSFNRSVNTAEQDTGVLDDPYGEVVPTEHVTESVETEPVIERQEAPNVQQVLIINEKAQQSEEESSSSSSSEEAKPKSKKGSKKKSLSIAEFLARKEEPEVAKIRVCIVQQDDTLELIAERYEISTQQLLNENRLAADQDVSEGQVLYVPVEYAARGSK